MAPTIERITTISSSQLGEGPHWDEETQSLYFVDIFGQSINRYVPSTGQHTKAQLENRPSIIIPVKGKPDQFVSTTGKDIVVITWDGQSEKVSKIEKIAEVEPENKNILNDGKCDSKGRLWIGTYDAEALSPKAEDQLGRRENTGTFNVLDNKKIFIQLTKIGCSNGLAWNKQNNKFYYIDSFKKTIEAFDFDPEKGITNRTEIFTLGKHDEDTEDTDMPTLPDGMTIDEDDNIWFAIFSGSKVLKIDPRKPETILQTIEIPAKQVTSLAWGGPNLDELYVTTGSIKLPHPENGAIYKITNLGTKGLPANKFII